MGTLFYRLLPQTTRKKSQTPFSILLSLLQDARGVVETSFRALVSWPNKERICLNFHTWFKAEYMYADTTRHTRRLWTILARRHCREFADFQAFLEKTSCSLKTRTKLRRTTDLADEKASRGLKNNEDWGIRRLGILARKRLTTCFLPNSIQEIWVIYQSQTTHPLQRYRDRYWSYLFSRFSNCWSKIRGVLDFFAPQWHKLHLIFPPEAWIKWNQVNLDGARALLDPLIQIKRTTVAFLWKNARSKFSFSLSVKLLTNVKSRV